MENEKVDIEFTSSDFIAMYGKKLSDVPPTIAKRYESQGLAKILIKPPVLNVKIKEDEAYNMRDCFSPEELLLTKVCWLSDGKEDEELISVGKKLGFKPYFLYNSMFKIYKLIVSDISIIDGGVSSFGEEQISIIKSCLFQRRIKFVYIVPNMFEEITFLMHSLCNIYFEEENLNRIKDIYGKMFSGIVINDLYEFWKELDSII